jgi:hypothetical protein
VVLEKNKFQGKRMLVAFTLELFVQITAPMADAESPLIALS